MSVLSEFTKSILAANLPGSRAQVLAGASFGSYPNSSENLFGDGTFDGIPTMVTERELRFLTNFFASRDIDGDVLEIGSYLGGSTSAIGRGLAAADFDGTYHVLDQFNCDFDAFRHHMVADCEKMAKSHSLSAETWGAIRANDWLPAFREVHSKNRYGRFLRAERYRIPSQPGETAGTIPLPAKTMLGAVFIDGFKTWHSTYAAMLAIVPHIRKGTAIIFQDFSWFDCYWLPVLADRLKPNMTMVVKVDNTATFTISDPDLLPGIDAFGSDADPAKSDYYRSVLRNYATAMYHSGDDVGFLMHTAQEYALCCALGLTEEARAVLTFLDGFCERVNAQWLPQSLRVSLPLGRPAAA